MDYMEEFYQGELPAYKVSCRYCGIDLWERFGERHKPDCPRHNPDPAHN